MTAEDVDVTSIRIHLNELKTQFDRAILEGTEFASVKKLYIQIKELECHLNVMEWEANHGRTPNVYNRK